MANILVVSSDRPKGNIAQLAEAFASGARDAGHLAETVSLLKTKVEACMGCNACKQALCAEERFCRVSPQNPPN